MNIFRSPAQIAITILCCRDSSPPFRVSRGLCQCQGLIITPQSTLHIGGSSLPDMGDPSPLCLTTLIIQHNTNTPLPLEASRRISWLTIRDQNVNYTSFLWGGGWADVSTSDVATVRIMGSRNKVWGSDHVRPIVWGSETCLVWRQECLWWCDISLLTPSTRVIASWPKCDTQSTLGACNM